MPEIAPVHFDVGNVDITLTPPTSPQSVGQALLENKPFPDDAFQDGAISLGDIKAAASKDFKLDKVKFKAGGSVFAGFGVYRSRNKLLSALKAEGMDEPMVGRLDLPDDETKDLYALRWGYEASGSVSGTVAFGPSITFGASGRTEGLYALLRSRDRTANALDSIGETINSWRVPRQVSAPGDMKPGTWLISETEGEIKLSLGMEYGYNYNWVREALTLGGLTGDFGFKIEMGIKAQLDFTAAGRYALVLARESASDELRLQIFRMRQHGWAFAFDANLGAQVKQNLIPDNFDDFIKGVFNVHGLQALKDIGSEFNKWTNPNNKLKDLLGAELVKYAEEMVERITGINPETDIDGALDKLRKPIELWNALPHEIASMLYGILRKGVPLDDLRAFLQQAMNLSDPEKLVDKITEQLRGAAFFETPAGKWLAAAAKEGILSLLADLMDEKKQKAAIKQLTDLAQKTLGLLDGSTVEGTLRKLQDWIESRLGLDKILALTDLTFADIDKWLKKRLSDFLGKSAGVVFTELEKIKDAINFLRTKANEFYVKGYNALIDKYKAEFHYSYQKTTTSTALIDVTFDFAGNEANAKQYLAQAIKGDFTKLLTDLSPTPGVKINKGLFTHEIKRNSHIGVNLPFFSATLDHINKSLTSGEVVDTVDGRLWVFNLSAEDVVSRKTMMSKLSVAMQINRKAGVRQFSEEDYSYNYMLRFIKRNARREYMEDKLQTLVNEYLPTEFSGDGKQPFSTFLTALDKTLDEKGITGDDQYGDILIGFDVSVPSKVLGAWKNVPVDKNDPAYMVMSRRVQNLMRHWIPLAYIQEPDQYAEIPLIYPLLAYCSLPPINRVKLTSSGQLKFTQDKVHDWDWRDAELVKKVLEQYGAPKLRDDILPRIRKQLQHMPGVQSDYADSKINKILALKTGPNARTFFESLMFTESELITGIHEAGQLFRKHVDEKKLDVATEELTKFGAALTDTFNNKVGNTIYEGNTVRPLGSLLFIEVSKIFDPALENKVQPLAMLELLIMQKQSTFAMGDFLKGITPKASELALQQRIVNVGKSSL